MEIRRLIRRQAGRSAGQRGVRPALAAQERLNLRFGERIHFIKDHVIHHLRVGVIGGGLGILLQSAKQQKTQTECCKSKKASEIHVNSSPLMFAGSWQRSGRSGWL